jgi:Protein of unknown function (DUF1634)
MNTDIANDARLQLLLARLLHHGRWLATAVIGLGLVLAIFERRPGAHNPTTSPGMRIVAAGIACFIVLPVLRVVLMLGVFVRAREYHFIAITSLVLIIILVSFAIGMYLPPSSRS